MNHKWPSIVVAVVLLCSFATAQRTWRVGPWWDPVTDFTQIQPAFDAASPGDTIIVDQGSGPFTPAITNKGVALLSTNAWSFGGQITVENLPADQTFVAEGFGGVSTWTFRNCQGFVHIEELSFLAPPGGSCGNGRGVKIYDCRLVTLNSFYVVDLVVENSTLLASDYRLYGTPDCSTMRATGNPALRMINSDVTLAHGLIIGARTYPPAPVVPTGAIYMEGGTLRIGGCQPGLHRIEGTCVNAPFAPLSWGPSIESYGGTVTLDPDVTLLNGYAGDSPVVREELPYMVVRKVPPPSVGILPLDVYAPPGASAIVALSLPALPLSTVLGDLWLDPTPGGIVVAASGVVPPEGVAMLSSGLSTAWPPGTAPSVQAVIVHDGQIRLSIPSIGVSGVPF